MTAGLLAAPCRNDQYEGAKKLRFCTLSLTIGAWIDALPQEKSKRAILHLEKGIALSQIGENDQARTAFERALTDARRSPGPWEQALHQRIFALEDNRIRPLWLSIVEAQE